MSAPRAGAQPTSSRKAPSRAQTSPISRLMTTRHDREDAKKTDLGTPDLTSADSRERRNFVRRRKISGLNVPQILRRRRVRRTEMSVAHKHYCNIVPLKATPFVTLGGDATESEDLFVPILRPDHVV